MINQGKTRWFNSLNHDVVTGSAVIQEGAVLTKVMEGGVAKVRACNADERIYGFALHQRTVADKSTKVEDFVVPATLSQVLAKAPVGGVALVKRTVAAGSGTVGVMTVVGVAPTTVDEVQLSDQTLTFHADASGDHIEVTYEHELTYAEHVRLVGEGVPGLLTAMQAIGSIGVITNGVVFTDQYDVTVDWATVDETKIVAAAGGKLGYNATATAADARIFIESVPSVGNPFLGVRIAN